MVAKGKEGGRGTEWEFGISRYKLVYAESINNTGNCAIKYSISCDKP